MRLLTRVATTAGLLAIALPAVAGRPLQTEDAGVLEPGACEVEGVLERVRAAGDRARSHSLGLQCGIGLRSQLGLGGSGSKTGDERGRSAGLGGKTLLWRGTGDEAPAVTLAWGLDAERADGHWRRSGHFLKAVASVGAGPGSLHANLGHARERQPRRSLTTWNLAWEHEGLALGGLTLAPMAELHGDDRGDRFWNLAARLTLVPERLFVDVSWGRQFNADKARLLTAGFKLAF